MTYKQSIIEIEKLLNENPEINLQNYTHEDVVDSVALNTLIWDIVKLAKD